VRRQRRWIDGAAVRCEGRMGSTVAFLAEPKCRDRP
jgi:hypothetical protein